MEDAKNIGISFVFFVLSIFVSVGIFLVFMYLIIKPDITNKTNDVTKRVDTVVNDLNSQLSVSKQQSDSQMKQINDISHTLPMYAVKSDVYSLSSKLDGAATKNDLTALSSKVDAANAKLLTVDSLSTTQATLLTRQAADEASIQYILGRLNGVATNAAAVQATTTTVQTS
jgi:hypothetical protein